VLEEYGIELYLALEGYTSMECSLCSEIHSNGRIYRGLYICRKTKRRINADLNAASNITRRIGYKVKIKKIASYIVTHNGLKPITPLERITPKTPTVETRHPER
jgi:putative transposase